MKCKDCSVPPMYDYQENCVVCLDGIMMMNISKFMLTEKMVVFTEKRPLKSGIRKKMKRLRSGGKL